MNLTFFSTSPDAESSGNTRKRRGPKTVTDSGTKRRFCMFALACLFVLGMPAAGQTFPSQPIKLVVPTSPGSSPDVLARGLARVLNQQTGVAVFVENKAGASGALGVQSVVRAKPDGYTLLLTAPDAVTVLPNLRKDLPYQVERDLIPIASIAQTGWAFAVPSKFPANTLKELVQLAFSKAGSVKFASPGTGTSAHLIAEMFASRANIQMLHVPYNGAGPATVAALGEAVDLVVTSPASMKGLLDSGKLRGLAFTGADRAASLPNVPTMMEAGFPDFVATAWYGVFAPAGLPSDIQDQLEKVVDAAARSPEFQKLRATLALDSRPMTRKEFAESLPADSARWRQVITRSKIVLE